MLTSHFTGVSGNRASASEVQTHHWRRGSCTRRSGVTSSQLREKGGKESLIAIPTGSLRAVSQGGFLLPPLLSIAWARISQKYLQAWLPMTPPVFLNTRETESRKPVTV